MFSRKPGARPKRALGPGRSSGTALPHVGELRQEQVSCRTETFTSIKETIKLVSLKNARGSTRQTPATPKRVSQCMEQLRQAYSTFHINSTGRGKPGLGGLGGTWALLGSPQTPPSLGDEQHLAGGGPWCCPVPGGGNLAVTPPRPVPDWGGAGTAAVPRAALP